MIFNSIEFLLFLPIVFILFWFVCAKSIKLQNALLIVASYIFYGCWDWRFLGLIIFSSVLDYTIGRQLSIEPSINKRKLLLYLSVLVNLGCLGFFKYFNFFIDSFEQLITTVGIETNLWTLQIILPVGISFYTFQTLSYTIDVYKKEIEASTDPLAFFAYVAFFPQLVAGPIERAKQFLPQFYTKKKFNYTESIDGCRQILWGFFKKIVIADNCAPFVDQIFADPTQYSNPVLFLGAVLFAFQIYGDFSGYTDIAIGVAKLFGFKLMRNFAYPYFSRDIAEFWRRWHISLSSWFKDYLYFPLGGSRGSLQKTIRNVFIIFLVSGFWHGANWTFIVWGGLNALYFLPSLIAGSNRKNLDMISKDSILPPFSELYSILTTFTLTCLAWIFFRAESISHAITYLSNLFNPYSIHKTNTVHLSNHISISIVCSFIMVLIIVEWAQRRRLHGLERMPQNQWLRYFIYTILSITIIYHFSDATEFIYFQF